MNAARLMQGNEACAEGALAAGVRFFGGYPITPSTEIAESMALLLPKVGGKFIQMEDEIASMAVVLGASLAGKKVLTATSGPGFSLKQELIGYAAIDVYKRQEQDIVLAEQADFNFPRAEGFDSDEIRAAELQDEHRAVAVVLKDAAFALRADGQGEFFTDLKVRVRHGWSSS